MTTGPGARGRAAEQITARVRAVLNEVLDPCSVGRSVPAGLVDMGMVCGVEVDERDGGQVHAEVTLRLTSPGCTFHTFFEKQVRDRVALLDEVASLEIRWSREFDWSDDDMSDDLRARLRARRARILEAAGRSPEQRPTSSVH